MISFNPNPWIHCTSAMPGCCNYVFDQFCSDLGQAFRVNRMINNLRRVFVTIPVQIWIITNRVCWFTGHVIMWDPASITCHISVSFCCKLFKILIKIFTTKTYETVSEYFCQENDEIQTPCTKVLDFLFKY